MSCAHVFQMCLAVVNFDTSLTYFKSVFINWVHVTALTLKLAMLALKLSFLGTRQSNATFLPEMLDRPFLALPLRQDSCPFA